MKNILIATMIMIVSVATAQDNLYKKVKERLRAEHPELKLENKLIVINVWTTENKESREANVSLNKTFKTYEFAKLKGGSRGMIAVMISLNEDLSLNEITLGKDNIDKSISFVGTGLEVENVKNIIYDSNGLVIKKNFDTNFQKEISAAITR
jgi:hypothetical protein